MVSPRNSSIWCFVYHISPCCFAVSGTINLLRSNLFSKKTTVFCIHTITFGHYVSLNKYSHPWLISPIAAICLISLNLKNLNPYGTGSNRYSFKG
jgi:hypothetical protein